MKTYLYPLFYLSLLLMSMQCTTQKPRRILSEEAILKKELYYSFKDALAAQEKVYRVRITTDDIPQFLASIERFRGVQELGLATSPLYPIKPQTLHQLLSQLPDLQYLEMNVYHLTTFPTQLKLPYMKVLRIHNSEFTQFPPVILQMPWLEELVIDKSKLSELPEAIGTRLKRLKIINFDQSKIKALPESMGELSQLEWVNFMHVKLSRLPASMGKLKQLQKLNLSYTELPAEELAKLATCSNLTHLYLAGNKLDKLPEELGQLKKLKFFDLNYNHFKTQPRSIGSCLNLTYLDIGDNLQLSQLAFSLRNLKKLQQLHIQRTNLATLPFVVCDLESLQRLALHHTPIKNIEADIKKLTNLEELYLYDCPNLRDVPEEVTQLKKLKKLHLYNTLISEQCKADLRKKMPGVEIL